MSLRDNDRGCESALRKLGRDTASELEAIELEAIEDTRLAAQQQRLLRSLRRPAPRVRLSWQLGLATALAGAAALALIWVFLGSPAESIYCIDPSGTRLAEGATLENKQGDAQVFRFSEGSELALSPGAKVTLTRLSEGDVRVSLTTGRIDAEIRHASQRRWSFSAGPYETLVVGTQLSIHWNAEARSM
ncbi:MAG: FecR domain-containing protein, partial [Deltaproteobacteria bacterium]|nr:FecR domain-containing protein [Deltaproteobacteria bacterium]